MGTPTPPSERGARSELPLAARLLAFRLSIQRPDLPFVLSQIPRYILLCPICQQQDTEDRQPRRKGQTEKFLHILDKTGQNINCQVNKMIMNGDGL